MADRGTATFKASQPFIVVTNYTPVMPGSGGGEPVTPKRYLNVAGTAVPIQ